MIGAMGTRSRGIRAAPLLIALWLAVSSTGCITRTVRRDIYTDAYTEIFLRGEKKGGAPVERGFQHPADIAAARFAHILSRIDLRIEVKKDADRVPAIPTDTLYKIAEGVSKGLAEADSSQEVVVLSILREKRWGIFDRKYLTSFLAYVKDELLYLHFSRADWEVPASREDRLPQPHVGQHVMSFRVLPSRGMTVVDPQSVAVAWRDPIFKQPSRVRSLPGGKVVRRTILMESPEEEEEKRGPDELPANLSSRTLRRLADLEDERRSGAISEGEYDLRRREIIRADPASR
jgi:hypothetical protein